MQGDYQRNVYKPNDFSEENLPRRQRHFQAPKKSLRVKIKLPKQKVTLVCIGLLFLYLISRLILGPLQGFLWNIPNIIGLPFHDSHYAFIVFDDQESFGSTGKALWFGEMHFSKGLYNGMSVLEEAPALPGSELNPVRQALFETKDYPLSFFNFDLSLESNYQELQKFYPEKDWDGLIFVHRSLVENQDALSKQIAWRFYNPFLWPFASRDVAENLKQQKILVYFEHESLQKKVDVKNWSGQSSFPHDYFLGGLYGFTQNFPTTLIHKDIRYYLYFLDEKDSNGNPKVQAELRVSFENNSQTQDFSGYWRWLIPKEARILSKLSIQEKYPKALGIGEKISLKTGERKEYIYRYELAHHVWNDAQYRWNYLAQGAWSKDRLRFVAHAPSSMDILSSSLSVHEGLAYTYLDLQNPQEIRIDLTPDEKTPEWLGVKILSPTTLELLFSEVMGPSAEDPSRYRISQSTVLSATKQGAKIILDIESLGSEEREVQIMLKGLRDLNGNPLDPIEPLVKFTWSQEWIDLFLKPVQDTEANPSTETSQTSL